MEIQATQSPSFKGGIHGSAIRKLYSPRFGQPAKLDGVLEMVRFGPGGGICLRHGLDWIRPEPPVSLAGKGILAVRTGAAESAS